MAQKKITDLSLRSSFDETCNAPVDDATQTWRITGAQILAFIKKAIRLVSTNKTANYTAVANTDDVIVASASGGSFAVTLPDAAASAGKLFRVIRTDSSGNTLTVGRTGSDTINGQTSVTIDGQYASMGFFSTGTEWVIV